MPNNGSIVMESAGSVLVENCVKLYKNSGYLGAIYDWERNVIIFQDKEGKTTFNLDQVAEEARRKVIAAASTPRKK